MKETLAITELVQTCGACPSQWEGTLDDGRVVYIRYRFGRLSWGVGATLDDAAEASFTQERHLGRGDLDGWLSELELPDLLPEFVFP